jgi:phosphohistidine phosphatase
VLSSPAERARASAAIVVKAAQIDAELRYDERIYEATIEQLAEVVAQLDDAVDEVLLVGHNPGMAELIEYLTGEAREMPTAALARLRLDVESWSEVHELCGQLESLVKPKDIE